MNEILHNNNNNLFESFYFVKIRRFYGQMLVISLNYIIISSYNQLFFF